MQLKRDSSALGKTDALSTEMGNNKKKTGETDGRKKINAPGRGRTYGLLLRKQTLYPLSYRRFDAS